MERRVVIYNPLTWSLVCRLYLDYESSLEKKKGDFSIVVFFSCD